MIIQPEKGKRNVNDKLRKGKDRSAQPGVFPECRAYKSGK